MEGFLRIRRKNYRHPPLFFLLQHGIRNAVGPGPRNRDGESEGAL